MADAARGFNEAAAVMPRKRQNLLAAASAEMKGFNEAAAVMPRKRGQNVVVPIHDASASMRPRQ